MKGINYKAFKNLPKYDIGVKPIGSGFQRGSDVTQIGFTERPAELVVSSGIVPQAISQGLLNASSPLLSLGQNASKYVTAYNSALKSALDANTKNWANKFGGVFNVSTESMKGTSNTVASLLGEQAGKEAAKTSAKGAASKALGAANIALNAYSAIHGGIGLYNNINDDETLSGGDLSNMSARNTEYTNGVGYTTMGGYDSSGVDKYVREQNKANTIQGIGSGLETGAGIGGLIGSIFTPIGGLIGSGIGAVLGAIGGGLFGSGARRRRERAIEEAKRNYAIAATNYNQQSESEAASQGLRNQYYATHADYGLPISNKKPNAFVGALETLVGTDKNGNVTSALTLPEDSNHKQRRDDYLVHLDKGTGVAGNKIDPSTGLTIAEKVAPLAMMFNSTINKKDKKVIGDAIKDEMELQDVLPDNNPNPYETIMADKGRSIRKFLPRFDVGAFDYAGIPVASYLMNELDDYAMKKLIDREPVVANMSYAPNPYIMQAGKFMPTTVDVTPQLRATNDDLRHYNYAIDQSSGSAGLKMVQKLAGFGKAMKTKSDILADKTNRENALRQSYAQWLSSVGESAATRMQNAIQHYNDMLARGYAQKRLAQDTIAKSRRSNRKDFAQNLLNIMWGNKTRGLFEQDLDNRRKEIALKIANGYYNNNKPS